MSSDYYKAAPVPGFLATEKYASAADFPVTKFDGLDLYQSHIGLSLPFADAAGTTNFCDIDGAGMAQVAPEAQFLCLMELIERASALSGFTIRKCLGSIKSSGIFIPWEALCPYSQEQVELIHRSSNHALQYHVPGKGLLTGRDYNIPAFAVFPRWKSFIGAYNHTPIPESDGSGIASGFAWERDAIIYRALCEVLERDAVMLCWRLKNWPATIIEQAAISPELSAWAVKNNLTFSLYNVGDDALLPVVVALLHNADNTQVTLGSSCGKGEHDVNKAALEAIMLRKSALALEGVYPLFPDEAIDSSEMHLLYGWRNGGKIMEYFGSKPQGSAYSVKKTSIGKLLRSCLDVYGNEPIAVDLTDPRMAGSRYRVFRVIQPGAYKKEYRQQYMYEGGKRLSGLLAGNNQLNRLPHPVA